MTTALGAPTQRDLDRQTTLVVARAKEWGSYLHAFERVCRLPLAALEGVPDGWRGLTYWAIEAIAAGRPDGPPQTADTAWADAALCLGEQAAADRIATAGFEALARRLTDAAPTVTGDQEYWATRSLADRQAAAYQQGGAYVLLATHAFRKAAGVPPVNALTTGLAEAAVVAARHQLLAGVGAVIEVGADDGPVLITVRRVVERLYAYARGGVVTDLSVPRDLLHALATFGDADLQRAARTLAPYAGMSPDALPAPTRRRNDPARRDDTR